MTWPPSMCIFSNMVKPSCISAAPEICVSTIFGLTGRAAVGHVDQPGDRARGRSRCRPRPRRRRRATIQNGVDVGREPGRRIGRHVVRLVDAGADDVAGLHAVFLLEQLGERDVAALRLADLARQRLDLVARLLGREPHRVAHVEQRARAERAHVVGRHVGVALHDLARDSAGMLSTSPTICAMAVSEPWPMSTVPQ